MNKPESIPEVEAVARIAARIIGQDYGALPKHSQEYWTTLVRQLNLANVQTAAEHAAAQAIAEWQTPPAAEEAAPVTTKKRGK